MMAPPRQTEDTDEDRLFDLIEYHASETYFGQPRDESFNEIMELIPKVDVNERWIFGESDQDTDPVSTYEYFLGEMLPKSLHAATVSTFDAEDKRRFLAIRSAFVEAGGEVRPKTCNIVLGHLREVIRKYAPLVETVMVLTSDMDRDCRAAAGRHITRNPIMTSYAYGPGGPVERAWHPRTGPALHRYAADLFGRQH